MKIIQKHSGCADQFGCMGPMNEYYTVFGTELRFLAPHFLGAFFICAFVYYLLIYHFKSTYLSRLPKQFLVVTFTFDTIIVFLTLAYFFPVKIHY